MKRSFALLLVAAVYACSSDKDDTKRTNAAVPAETANALKPDTMAMQHDSTMGSMKHDSAQSMNRGSMPSMNHESMAGGSMNHESMKPGSKAHATMDHRSMSDKTMPGMKHGQMAAMSADGKHVTAGGEHQQMKHDSTMPMRHDNMTSMRHDSMTSMRHDMMTSMRHDTMTSMRHDTMTSMRHDTMTSMRHDTMTSMAHDSSGSMAHNMAGMEGMSGASMMSDMLMTRIGSFTLMGMAQFFPTYSFAYPRDTGTPLHQTGFYVTQPAIMMNLSSPNERWVLRTTLNFEGITQPNGELTFGGWGEGFIDKRHPHTLLHEFMLSWNNGNSVRGFSISAGKGFAPYGTDDPMSRPILKYPTNHHLSQALERWTLSSVFALRTWGLEAAVFGGQEPTGPYDFSNIRSFGDSWSARATKRFGTGKMGTWPWELSASAANIAEDHEGVTEHTKLINIALRHDHEHEGVPHYALAEYSRSTSSGDDPYFSMLAESSVRLGRHQPYGRIEYANRPEYQRNGPRTTNDFFRYDHDTDPIGATRWLIVTAGYGVSLSSSNRLSPRPFVEVQYNRIRPDRGGIDPAALFGRDNFWSMSAGLRVFVGGEPMRMGTYGILDPMTAMHDMSGHQMSAAQHEH